VDTRSLRGIALLIGAMYATDLFSAFMSSPWSTEAFGADEARAKSARRLVWIAIASAITAGAVGSILDRNPWLHVGAGTASGVMWWLYEDALKRGQDHGYEGVDLSAS